MSKVEITKITDRTGSGAPNFTNGFNIAGADSGISGFTHTEGSSDPSSPSNGDTWWDSGNDIYKVYMNNAWQDFLGTSAPPVSGYNGARGFWFGGTTLGTSQRVDTIEYVAIATPGNAQDFGDLTIARWAHQGASSGARGVMAGGRDTSNNHLNVIDYITCATAGNAQDFGDLTVARREVSGASNGTRGLIFNGREDSAGRVNTIEYVTIANTGNATDFGDSLAARTGNTAVNGETRALNAGSYDWATDDIEYVTVDTTGNATDFGDLTDASTKGGSAADATRGLIALGANTSSSPYQTNKIDYVTHANAGNATDFGDLTQARRDQPSGCSDGTYACFGGGEDAPNSTVLNIIDRVTIQTAGNATDFGDLTSARKTVGSLAGNAA